MRSRIVLLRISLHQFRSLSGEIATLGQQRPEFAESIEWLEANGDTSKLYVLPDGYIYAFRLTEKEVENGPAYTNLLPTATDEDRASIFNRIGYLPGNRLSSSGGVSASQAAMCASGFIPAVEGDVVRIKGLDGVTGVSSYAISYDSANARVCHQTFTSDGAIIVTGSWYTYDAETDMITFTLSSDNFGSGFDAFRFSGAMTDNTIVTVNEEISEGSGTTIVEECAWASTGHAFVPADYEERIIAAETHIADNKTEIDALKKGTNTEIIKDPLTYIRNWDAPIYDANIPVFQLSGEKAALTDAILTPDTIYAMYDALMMKHPRYITKTDLGLCSDGVNHIYCYDFREPEPYHQSNMPWSETKIKAILASGIHYEWAGIFALYYALEEMADNPDLYHLRRNTHFIVIPVLNPYCTITANYNASIGVLNANGVQIHRNFEVGFIYPGESGYVEYGERNHGGTEPLSEVETQCLDNIFKEHPDAAFFLTCHNFDSPSSTNGLGFIWASTATKYMCNMGFRLVDKMTKAWLDTWRDDLEAGIANYRTDNVTDDFIRFGHAHVSLTDGTETRQATKYGIQGANIEICCRFYPHGTLDNVEPSLSEFTLSRGAETYINFLLTACGCYDYKDKREYSV